MPDFYWGVGAVISILGSALIAHYITKLQHERDEERRVRQRLEIENAKMETEVGNMKRISRNKLYRESLEDIAAARAHALMRLAVLEDEAHIIRQILETSAKAQS